MKNTKLFKVIITLTLILGFFSLNLKQAFAFDTNEEKIQEEGVQEEKIVLPDKEWSIKFSKGINKDTITNDNIYVLDSSRREFSNIVLEPVESESEDNKDKKEIKEIKVIPTKEYKQGEEYSLYITSNVKSNDGKGMSKPYKFQFKVKKIDSDYFKIRNVKAISKNTINVYFTHPVGKEAEQALFYEVLHDGSSFVKGSYKTMSIHALKECNNGVQINLKEDTLYQDENYTISILGDLMSSYGVRLLDGFGDEKEFLGTSKDEEELSLNKAIVLGDTCIELSFNKELDKTASQNIENYSIREDDGNTIKILKANLLSDGNKVDLQVDDTLKMSKIYTLSIRNLQDVTKGSILNLTDYKTEKRDSDECNLSVDSIKTLSSTVLQVNFNRGLNKDDALNEDNFYIIGRGDTSYSKREAIKTYINEEDSRILTLSFDKEFENNGKYKFCASKYIRDKYFERCTTNIYCDFYASVNEEDSAIENVVTIGKEHIKVQFGQAIKNEGVNLNPSNYSIEHNDGGNRKVVIGCSEVKYVDPVTLVLKFDGMDDDEDYLLKISSLLQYDGNTDKSYADGIDVKHGTY